MKNKVFAFLMSIVMALTTFASIVPASAAELVIPDSLTAGVLDYTTYPYSESVAPGGYLQRDYWVGTDEVLDVSVYEVNSSEHSHISATLTNLSTGILLDSNVFWADTGSGMTLQSWGVGGYIRLRVYNNTSSTLTISGRGIIQ